MAFKGVPPQVILGRVLCLDIIRQFPPHLVYRVEAKAVTVFEGEDGEDDFEMNWGWLLFDATQHQLENIMGSFTRTEESQKKEIVKSLILDNFGNPIR